MEKKKKKNGRTDGEEGKIRHYKSTIMWKIGMYRVDE